MGVVVVAVVSEGFSRAHASATGEGHMV